MSIKPVCPTTDPCGMHVSGLDHTPRCVSRLGVQRHVPRHGHVSDLSFIQRIQERRLVMNILKYQQEIEDAQEELAAIRIMSEADVCKLYNTDSREEIVLIIMEDIVRLKREIANDPDISEEEEAYTYLFNY